MDSIIFPQLPTYFGSPDLAGILSLAVTVLLPVLAALFMKSHWSAFRKGLVLFVFAAVKAYLEAWLGAVNHDEAFNFVAAAYSTVVQFVLAVAFYFGLLQRTAVQQAALNGGPVNAKTVDGSYTD